MNIFWNVDVPAGQRVLAWWRRAHRRLVPAELEAERVAGFLALLHVLEHVPSPYTLETCLDCRSTPCRGGCA